MKKYFQFDNEPITGTNYWMRVLIGTPLCALLVGFWVLAATGYKRAGTFGWPKEFRVLSAIFIPIVGVLNILAKSKAYSTEATDNLQIIGAVGLIFHLVLLLKDGNKK